MVVELVVVEVLVVEVLVVEVHNAAAPSWSGWV